MGISYCIGKIEFSIDILVFLTIFPIQQKVLRSILIFAKICHQKNSMVLLIRLYGT